jgi:hypothetical protein
MTNAKQHYRSPDAVEAIVRGFESCTLTPAEFNHQSHLVVALCYLLNSDVTAATERMRRGLHTFLIHHGHDIQIYNETITVFWVKRVQGFLEQTNVERPLVNLANDLVKTCDDARLIYNYYSKERLMSDAARLHWQEPDLQGLDF